MYNFGKTPPRNLRSFGVAGVLGRNCKIFYDSLFSSRNLGRTSDLLMARMREEGLDEFRFRSALLFNYFESVPLIDPDKPLLDPITIECGFDDEKIALGISFLYGDEASLRQLIDADDFKMRLMEHADCTIVRWDNRELRIELVCLFAIPGKIQVGEEPPTPTMIDLAAPVEAAAAEGASDETPEAGEYIQMGDLDYYDLLREERPGMKKAVFATGEILASYTIAPDPSEKNDVVRIKGTTEKISDQMHVKSSGEGKGEGIKGFLKSVWGMGGGEKAEKGSEPTQQAEKDADHSKSAKPKTGPAAIIAAQKSEEQAPPAEESQPEALPVGDMRYASQSLVNSLKSGALSVGIENFQIQSKEFMRDLPPGSPMRKWLESVAAELAAQKEEVLESAKKVAASVRQRELELRQKEASLSDDLRRKDEVVYQKSAALKRAKDQLAVANAQLAKAKTATRDTSEESAYRQKFTMTQRLLTLERENTAKLKSEVDQLRETVNNLRLSQKDSPLLIENGSLKAKMDRLKIQYSQLKSMNEQLLKRVKQAPAESPKAAADEVRRKLESSMKLVAVQQKEIELLKAKLDEKEAA